MPLGLVLRWVSRLRSTRTELSVETGLARLLPELRDPAALARRNERLADLPEAGHRLLPRMGIGAAHRIAQRREYLAFGRAARSEEHTSELQSLMRISYAVFCLKTKKQIDTPHRLQTNTPRQMNH